MWHQDLRVNRIDSLLLLGKQQASLFADQRPKSSSWVNERKEQCKYAIEIYIYNIK